MSGALRSESDGHFCWRSAHIHDTGEGPASLPFPRNLRLQGNVVNLKGTKGHVTAVSDLLRSLERAAQNPVPAPDLAWLRLGHPCNTREHAAQLCRYVLRNWSNLRCGADARADPRSGWTCTD